MTPLASQAALDAYFLEARSKLLDVAAILDRIDRGGAIPADSRLNKIHEAIAALQANGPGRAERIQQIFSLPYDPTWVKPKPQ